MQAVSSGSWQTWKGRSANTQRCPGSQSRLDSHSVWQRLNAHTSGLVQSLLMMQPSLSLARASFSWLESDEHEPATAGAPSSRPDNRSLGKDDFMGTPDG